METAIVQQIKLPWDQAMQQQALTQFVQPSRQKISKPKKKTGQCPASFFSHSVYACTKERTLSSICEIWMLPVKRGV